MDERSSSLPCTSSYFLPSLSIVFLFFPILALFRFPIFLSHIPFFFFSILPPVVPAPLHPLAVAPSPHSPFLPLFMFFLLVLISLVFLFPLAPSILIHLPLSLLLFLSFDGHSCFFSRILSFKVDFSLTLSVLLYVFVSLKTSRCGDSD